MTVLFSPYANSQYFDNNGDPADGYTVTTYAAGSSTPLATYTSATGLSSNANPVTLNAAGLNPNGEFWLTSGLSYKFVIKDAGGVEVDTVDGITGVNDPAVAGASDQWVAYAGTPTYISATSFSVVGDQTNTFQVSRRLRTANTAGTTYSTISASSFGAGITTVTVVNTSGVLDSGLSQVSYGLISATNSSAPSKIVASAVQATTSGTTIDFLSIPPGVKRITVMFNGVSTSGTSNPGIRLGDAGGVETSGYNSVSAAITNAASPTANNFGGTFGILSALAANVMHGNVVLTLEDPATNTWTANGTLNLSNSITTITVSGSKALSAVLDRVQLCTSGGVDTFDAGSASIFYE